MVCFFRQFVIEDKGFGAGFKRLVDVPINQEFIDRADIEVAILDSDAGGQGQAMVRPWSIVTTLSADPSELASITPYRLPARKLPA